jgi:hypothetical protein
MVLFPESAVVTVGVVTCGVLIVVAALAVGGWWSQCWLLPSGGMKSSGLKRPLQRAQRIQCTGAGAC